MTISTRGNVMRFVSPWAPPNIESAHLDESFVSEGYVLCYNDPSPGSPVHAYDLGDVGQNGFGAPTATCYTNQPLPHSDYCIITRNTSAGVLQLQQRIFCDDTIDGPHKRFLVWMRLANLKNAPVSVDVLRRQVDLNIDSGGTNGWNTARNNIHSTTGRDGAFAWNPEVPGVSSHGIRLRSITRPSGEDTATAKVTQDPRDTSCNPPNFASSGIAYGDYGDSRQYEIGTIPANGSRVVLMEYARY